VGLGLGLGVGSGASKLLIADCRYAIRRDRVPVSGTGYTTFFKYRYRLYSEKDKKWPNRIVSVAVFNHIRLRGKLFNKRHL